MNIFDSHFVGHKEKINPNTLLSVLWDICRTMRYSSYEDAAEELEGNANFSWNTRPFSISKDSFRYIFRQRTIIKYWHLEAFSRIIGVPTGILLLYSRLRSNADKGNFHENDQIIELLRYAAENYDPNKVLEIDTLFEWAELLRGPIERQLSLDIRRGFSKAND